MSRARYGSMECEAKFVCGMIAAWETFTVNSDKARQQAERRFKKEERAEDGGKVMMEYERQALATREKMARLREMRLAKEAEKRSVTIL
jgi:hypothetical protein